MNITKKGLGDAVEENIISSQQADALFEFFKAHSHNTPVLPSPMCFIIWVA